MTVERKGKGNGNANGEEEEGRTAGGAEDPPLQRRESAIELDWDSRRNYDRIGDHFGAARGIRE